jgi:hypothetical protein
MQDAGLRAAALSTYINWTNNTGHAFVKECEIEIGGQRIDKHYSQWLDIWNELTDHDESEWIGLNKHAAKNAYLKNPADGTHNVLLRADNNDNMSTRLYVPLQFWFCRNPGLALPLIALQYHEVKIKITTRACTALVNSDATTLQAAVTANPNVQLWADYIYLDTDERRRFAQVSHEYLIEQLQRETGGMSSSQKLNFNHPVKELVWVVQEAVLAQEGAGTTVEDPLINIAGSGTAYTEKSDYFDYSNSGGTGTGVNSEFINNSKSFEGFATAKLVLNGHDRFAARNATYFRTCQPLQAGHRVPSKHIYNYSFALKPEEHQPSGTCNFSRIDNAKLVFTTGTAYTSTVCTLSVYAVNYNVLRIMSGMGGLAYSN